MSVCKNLIDARRGLGMDVGMTSPEATQCIVRPHHMAGVFSLVNKVLTCMELYSRVKVEFLPEQTRYKSAEMDIWKLLFDDCEATELADGPADVVVEYPHNRYTNANAGNAYCRNDGWRFRLHTQFSRLRVRDEVLQMAQTILPGELEKAVGVVCRGEKPLAREQRTGVLPTPNQMGRIALQVAGDDGSIFVAADSKEATELFARQLGKKMLVWEDCDRCEKIGQAVHGVRAGTGEVKRALALALALSRTKHLVHAVSNLATAVLYINPRLEHTFVEVTAQD